MAIAAPTSSPTALDLVGVILVGGDRAGTRSALQPADLAGRR
jgi:hypothetical protein